MTWPLPRLSRKKVGAHVPTEACGGVLAVQASASGIALARGEAELHQTRTEYRDEVDAYVERERRDWLEELV
jgi:hypothetical protein